ncbi:cytochrome c peroxidase [bacterium A37T11]|nr:cytochrome c peroxidase [bacterium A37T11]
MKKAAFIAGLLLLVVACKKGAEVLPDLSTLFTGFIKPADFPDPVYDVVANPVSEAQFELGKKLFNDARLSRNNTIACSSCHIQSSGFTQHGHDVSHGVDDRLGTRNSPQIMNLAWNKAFFWDGGVTDLDLQPMAPIENPVEMDEKVPNILEKLRADSKYPGLFKDAYGTDEITSSRFLKSLSAYMIMLISDQSKYDSVRRKQAIFTVAEQRGYTVFKKKCASCHTEPLFTDHSYRNNGLAPSAINDLGRYSITLNASDRYKFKVPSLRNLQYTGPFMHDGRILNLAGVLDHYTGEVTDQGTLDPLLKQADGSLGISLTDADKSDLLSFLNTLNDHTFVRNKLFEP